MGDDDQYLEMPQGINPGKTKAIQAAKAVKGIAVFPIFAPDEQALNPKVFSDFNDLATKTVLGSQGAKLQIKGAIQSVIENKKFKNKKLNKLEHIRSEKVALKL